MHGDNEVCCVEGKVRADTVTERLERKKERLELELIGVNKALTALRGNPDVEEILNLLRQTGC